MKEGRWAGLEGKDIRLIKESRKGIVCEGLRRRYGRYPGGDMAYHNCVATAFIPHQIAVTEE
jgi:hypothetical protein